MKYLIKRKKSWLRLLLASGIVFLLLLLALFSIPVGSVTAQQPTGSIPTVTGTPAGPHVTVYADQNIIGVYAGPSSYNYERVGILLAGEKAPALGYSADQNWIQIVYVGVPGGKGWVYAPFVAISPGSLPTIPDPPTATPRTTPTLDPTLAAAYQVTLGPGRLPTYTPPPALSLPTFAPGKGSTTGIPFGFIVLGLMLVGVLGAPISFLRGNR